MQGKYSHITKILTDSDLDGIVSGALLRKVFPHAQIYIGDPAGMQSGKYDHLVDEHTVIADLKYVDGCGLYFDHHESNRPDHQDFSGSWEAQDSAAHVVFDFFKDDYDFSGFKDLIPEVDKLDMARFSLAEYQNPSPVMRLGLAISRDDRAFNHLLLELIATHGMDFALQHEIIRQKTDQAEQLQEAITEYIRENLKQQKGIGIIDMSDFTKDVRISSFEFTSLYPDLDALVVIKPEDEGFKVTLYSNSFKQDKFSYDLLSVAKALNPQASGGHKGACGFVPRPGARKDETVTKVLHLLAQQRDAAQAGL